jgi:uncharacterized protein (UPF0332 family)
MANEFEKCLKAGKIKKFSRGKALAKKEIRLAEEDLRAALKSFKGGDYRWCVVQVYYSMFHSARALLYFKNYREHSHYCLGIAIRELYVKTKELDIFFVEALNEAKGLREAADYYGDYSSANAKKLIKKAEDFIKRAKEIISLK